MPLQVTTLDDVVRSVRGQMGPKQLPQVNLQPVSFQRQGIQAVQFDVPVANVYDRLSDGTFIPKFENYTTGYGEEDRLARQQSAGEQWWNGAQKFLGKTALYASDAVLGTATGIYEGITQGRFDKVWDNSYSNMMDDLNKRMDNAVPNYYTDEQKSMGFLRSMGTANFWANDILGNGLSFVAGALLPEAALALASGGATLPSSLAKLGLKTTGKAVFKSALRAEAKDLAGDLASQTLKQTKNLNLFDKAETAADGVRALNRANHFGQVGNVLNTSRFLVQTSAFEAGMEARHNLKNSIDTYLSEFEQINGRQPSFEELSNFSKDAVSAGNGVFTANMGILALSNAAMFGKTFGVGVNFGKRIENAGNRLIGLGIKRDAAGKLALQQATKAQKFLGNTYKILSKPAIEGLYEEGLQGVAGTTMQNYLKAKYNPDKEDGYGLWASLTDAMAHQYGTQEGWKEMGIGMIIGLAGGSFTGAMQGKLVAPEGMGSSSYRARKGELQGQVDAANKAQSNIHKRVISATGLKNFANNMKSKAENFESTSVDNAVVNREYIKAQEQVKSKKEVLNDYNAVVDNMELTDDQIAEIGGQENLALYKQSLKDEFNRNLNDYRFARKVVKSLGLDKKLKGVGDGNLADIADAVEMNIMIGKSSLEAAKNIATQIDTLTGSSGVFSHLEHFNNLTQEQKDKVEEVRKKKRRISELTKLANKYGQEIASIPTGGRQFSDETNQRRYKQASEKRVVVQQELNKLNEEVEVLSEALNFSPFNVDQLPSTAGNTHDIEAMVEELDKVDSFIDSLDKSGRTQDAEMLSYLVDEYKQYSDAHREMNNMVRRMADTNFFSTKEGKGFKDTVLGAPYQMSEEFRNIIRDNDAVIDRSLKLVGYRGEDAVQEIIDRNITDNTNLSDRDKFKLESIIRLQLGYDRLQQRLAIIQNETEVVESVEEVSNNPLEGDTVRLRSRLNTEGRDLSNVGVLNELISQITSELDKFKIGRVDTTLIQSLESQLEELKARRDDLSSKEGTTIDAKADVVKSLIDSNILTPLNNGKTWMLDGDGRVFLVANINGNKVLFYTSSEGTSGKTEGMWYPVVGIANSGYIIKGSLTAKEDKYNFDKGYGIKEIKDFQDFLNRNLSNVKGQNLETLKAIFGNNVETNVGSKINKEFDLERLTKSGPEYAVFATKTSIGLSREEAIDIWLERFKAKETVKPIKAELASLETAPVSETSSTNELQDIDTKIAELEKQLEDAKNTKTVRIVQSPEYIRLNELNRKKLLEPLTEEESAELDQLEQDIDQWITITGIVAEGLRLSDLIQQKATLEGTPIAQLENVGEVTSQEVLSQVDFGDKTQATYYSIGQSYDAVTAVRVKDENGNSLIEISGITPEDFANEVGFPFPAKVNEQNNVLIDEETRNLINENSPISILPTNQSLVTNYSTVLRTTANADGSVSTEPLKSKFTTDFFEQQNPNAIYNLKPGDQVTLEVDPRDPWNKKLLDAYNRARSEKGKEKALLDLKNSLVIRVKDSSGNFVAVLKAKRKNSTKNAEAILFEAMRDQIVEEENFIERISSIKDAVTVDLGQVVVERTYLGYPSFNFTKNADGSVAIESKQLTDQDIAKIDDIGFLENGVIRTRGKKAEINTTFLAKSMKDTTGKKIPFVVVIKGDQRIAYPVRVLPNEVGSLDEFEKIYRSNTKDPVLKASALNKFMAQRGIDIKLPGNSFIAIGKDNLNDDFFSDKLAQLQQINYFSSLEPWADNKSDMKSLLKSGVSIDINLSDPFFSPKVKLNFSGVNVTVSTANMPQASSNPTTTRGVDALSRAIKNAKNEPC